MKDGFIKENVGLLIIIGFLLIAGGIAMLKGDDVKKLGYFVMAGIFAAMGIWIYIKYNPTEAAVNKWFRELRLDEKCVCKRAYEERK